MIQVSTPLIQSSFPSKHFHLTSHVLPWNKYATSYDFSSVTGKRRSTHDMWMYHPNSTLKSGPTLLNISWIHPLLSTSTTTVQSKPPSSPTGSLPRLPVWSPCLFSWPSQYTLHTGSRGIALKINHIMSLSCFGALRTKSKNYNKVYTTLAAWSGACHPLPCHSFHITLLWSLFTPVTRLPIPHRCSSGYEPLLFLLLCNVLSSILPSYSSSPSHTFTYTALWGGNFYLQALAAIWYPLGGLVCPPFAVPPPIIGLFLCPLDFLFYDIVIYIYLGKSLPGRRQSMCSQILVPYGHIVQTQ